MTEFKFEYNIKDGKLIITTYVEIKDKKEIAEYIVNYNKGVYEANYTILHSNGTYEKEKKSKISSYSRKSLELLLFTDLENGEKENLSCYLFKDKIEKTVKNYLSTIEELEKMVKNRN